jgi:hypothetical protein
MAVCLLVLIKRQNQFCRWARVSKINDEGKLRRGEILALQSCEVSKYPSFARFDPIGSWVYTLSEARRKGVIFSTFLPRVTRGT